MATRAQHTASAGGWLAASTRPGTVVVVAQNGVVGAGERHGVPTPLNRTVLTLLRAIAPG